MDIIEIDKQWIAGEPDARQWNKEDFPLQEETGRIIGICMEIHRLLGKGFLEIVYKDALEYECKKQFIPYEREKKFSVAYKEIILPHSFHADFVIFENVITEIKAQAGFVEDNYAQLINYLAVSKSPVGLLINFGDDSLRFKRFALTRK